MNARVMMIVLCALTAGCDTAPILNQAEFNNTMAKYAVLPDNKAIYINTSDYAMNWVWQSPSPQDAQVTAANNCAQNAASRGGNPAACVPVAVNQQQYWNASVQAQVDQQRQQQDVQNMQQMQQLIQQIGTMHR